MIWFDRQSASDLTATFALRIRVGRRPVCFGLHVDQGRMRVSRRAPANAGASVTAHAADLLRLASGEVGWPQLLAAGRLELTGDPFLALRFPGLFRLPSAPRRGRGRGHTRQARGVDASAL
jgi:predicted lipid carrier protein YhbT